MHYTHETSQFKHCYACKYFVLTQVRQLDELAALQVRQALLQYEHTFPTLFGNLFEGQIVLQVCTFK